MFSLSTASAQDRITRTDGVEVLGKVVRVTPAEVVYLPETPAGSTDTLHLNTDVVFLIRYADGKKRILHNPALPGNSTVAPALTDAELATKGREDAKRNYSTVGTFWGAYGATIAVPLLALRSRAPVIGPVLGVGVVATLASVRPSEKNFEILSPELRANPSYMAAYRKQARRKKAGSAIGGFGAALGTGAVAVAIIAYLLRDGFS
ncbi:hypothetical protein [Hymenobacter sp. BT491]|uniref:hypothetical protein n=1 Tax=Hymenobacter sp. BT491 TaxID=2766779 RepID=UPI001653DBD1|nr:hypothetical protein [Hymenobacter sp. BT491]MBC6991184.1 hypothetical protein [Hymenobacter sp. BT491]